MTDWYGLWHVKELQRKAKKAGFNVLSNRTVGLDPSNAMSKAVMNDKVVEFKHVEEASAFLEGYLRIADAFNDVGFDRKAYLLKLDEKDTFDVLAGKRKRTKK